jgi:hypothetical protein
MHSFLDLILPLLAGQALEPVFKSSDLFMQTAAHSVEPAKYMALPGSGHTSANKLCCYCFSYVSGQDNDLC